MTVLAAGLLLIFSADTALAKKTFKVTKLTMQTNRTRLALDILEPPPVKFPGTHTR